MKLGLCVVGCGAFARTFAQAMQSARDEVELFWEHSVILTSHR